MEVATRLKAPRHWSTCAGSLPSYKSTVRKRSCAGRFRGSRSQAERKCEMFSIWVNGMLDFLNRIPGAGSAIFARLCGTISETKILRFTQTQPTGIALSRP